MFIGRRNRGTLTKHWAIITVLIAVGMLAARLYVLAGSLNEDDSVQSGDAGDTLGAVAADMLGLPGARERLDARVHNPGMSPPSQAPAPTMEPPAPLARPPSSVIQPPLRSSTIPYSNFGEFGQAVSQEIEAEQQEQEEAQERQQQIQEEDELRNQYPQRNYGDDSGCRRGASACH